MIRQWQFLIVVSLLFGLFITSAGTPTTFGAAPAETPQLTLLKTISVGGAGRWDYLCVDSEAGRLYIPRSSHVQVLDLSTDKVIGDIPGTAGVHGVALAPDQGLGFSSNGSSNTVSVFDLKTFKVSKTIKTGRGPDAIIYDSGSKHIMAICHSGGVVTVIDPAALDKDPVTIQVGGTLEAAADDGEGHVFVNIEDRNQVVQIDSKENKVLARWPLTPGTGPTGLDIDVKNHRLFAGCGNRNMIVLDSNTGKKLASVAIGSGVDGVGFEPTLCLAMSANGRDGTLSVVKETSPGKFEAVQTPKTVSGARTIIIDTKKHQALLPTNVSGQTFGIVVVGVKEAK